jgi:hypothetical protein
MRWLQRLLHRPLSQTTRSRKAGARLCLEALENRLAPANVFVVPLSQASDATHVYLLSEAVNLAHTGGTVTVEPGASPDNTEPVSISTSSITIQGDPNVPASTLPSYQVFILSSKVTLTNMNLQSVTIGASGGTQSFFAGTTISKCIVGSITDFGQATFITQNTITGGVSLQRETGLTPPNDVIANNTFESHALTLLSVTNGFGTQITSNTFYGFGNNVGISLTDCDGFPNDLPTVANNTLNLTLTGQPNAGILVAQSGNNNISSVQVFNNTINTQANGIGIKMTMAQDGEFTAEADGNDLHGNAVGVSITCDGTTGAIGSQASIGMTGNNFRSFNQLPATASNAAIVFLNGPTTTIFAGGNLFDVNPPSSEVFISNGGTVNTSNSLISNSLVFSPPAFVQTLYLDDLGRVGGTSEINGWVSVFNAQGQAAVVNGIFRSSESLGRIVDSFYLRFLGRQSDPGGRAGWISFLQNGGTQEQLETDFLTSPEYLAHINTDFVQSLYINILGRTGSASELAGWNNQLQTLGLAGVANGFTHSTELRDDTATADYETYMYRAPRGTELSALVGSSQDLLSFTVFVQSTPEFFQVD